MVEKKDVIKGEELGELVKKLYGKKGVTIRIVIDTGEGRPTRCSIDGTLLDPNGLCQLQWICTNPACKKANTCCEAPYACKFCHTPRP